jgi:hypothetical protein
MADESVTPPESESPQGDVVAGGDVPAGGQDQPCGPGAGFVPRNLIVLLAALGVIAAVFVLYCLVVFWPATSNRSYQAVNFLGWRKNVSQDTLFFVIVALGGALGGLIHSIRSMSWYVGNRNLRWSWLHFNLMLPIVGALSGTVFYLVLRAGLLSPSASNEAVSPFGFTAVAVMAGLFSEQAMEKLKQIATDLFAERPQGEDHTDPGNPSGSGGDSGTAGDTDSSP